MQTHKPSKERWISIPLQSLEKLNNLSKVTHLPGTRTKTKTQDFFLLLSLWPIVLDHLFPKFSFVKFSCEIHYSFLLSFSTSLIHFISDSGSCFFHFTVLSSLIPEPQRPQGHKMAATVPGNVGHDSNQLKERQGCSLETLFIG